MNVRTRPQPRRDERWKHIVRPRVLASFAAAARSDVVLVVAPSGFGKSIALRQHLATLQSSGIEYRLRADFEVVDVVRALAALVGITEGLPTIAHAATERGLHPYVARWLAERIDEEAVPWIALEDVGLAGPEVRAFLGDLLAQPCSTRWYAVTREPADLRLGPLLGDGRLAPAIYGGLLAFDTLEISKLARSRGLLLTAEQSLELLLDSGGWPVAVSLALQQSGDGRFECQLPAAREALRRYVTERACSELRQADRDLLAWGAYVALRPELLERLGVTDAAMALRRLGRVIPLVRYADGEFSVHDLLMEQFSRIEALQPSSARDEKWRRVGDAHLDLGEHGDALRAFVACRDADRILRLLREYGDRLSELGFGADVARALAILPSERRRAEPALLLLEATAETERGRKDLAEDLLRLACAADSEIGRIAAVRLATDLINRGRPGAVEVLAPVALRYPGDPQIQSAFAVALAAAGDRVRLAGALAAGLQSVRRCEDPLSAARAYQRLGLAAHFAGARPEARLHCETALEIVVREGFDGGEARIRSLLYSIAVAEDDDGAIVAEATKMVTASRRAGLCQLEIAGLTALLVHAAERGDDPAYAEIERAFAGLGPVRGYADAFPYAFARAVKEARAGRLASAASSFDRIVFEAEEPPEIVACADALSTLLAAAREPAKARPLLAAFRKRSRRHAIDPRAATTHTIVLLSAAIAILESRHGQRTVAARSARQAVRSAATNRERALATAAHDLARAEEPREWSRAIESLRRAGLAGYADFFALLSPRQHAAPSGTLSSLEREILRLYAERRQAKEIADLLGRNVETVRTHIRNGMKKLGVKGREGLIDLYAASNDFGRTPTQR